MIKKNTIFDFLTQVFVIFGVTILWLLVFCGLFGEDGKAVSTIFQLGSEGIALSTVLQFFIMAVLITTLRMLLFTDMVIKNWSIAVRTIVMFALIIVMVAVFAGVFGWFPINMLSAWIAFLVSFAICAVVSFIVSTIKEKSDNKKLQDALERFCEGEEQ